MSGWRDRKQTRSVQILKYLGQTERRIWWLTVSKAADKSSRTRTEEREEALAVCRTSVTEWRAVSVAGADLEKFS